MNKELKIGLFAVLVMIASFFLLNYLRGEDIFDKEAEVVARYDNLEGLTASAPVYIKGYKAGKVTTVEYDTNKGDFIVTCSVLKSFNIPVDSKMTIYSVDIMGGKGIRLDLGSSSAFIQDGDTLMPYFEAGLMDGLADSITPLLQKVNTTLDSLNVTVSGVNRLLCESNQANIANTLAHLEKTVASASRICTYVEGKSAEMNELVKNLTSFSSKLTGIAESADTLISGVNQVVTSLNEADIEKLVVSFRTLLDNINDPEGCVGKLFVDDSVYNSIDSLLIDIDTLIKKIQENPKKYLKISVF